METKKVWISKYALTRGLYMEEVESTHVESMVSIPNGIMCFHKPGWHETKEEAIAQAEKMRQAKLKSLQKQIDKLTKTKFE